MRKMLIFSLVVGLVATPLLAGVVKKTKSDVAFKGFGRFTSVQTERLIMDRKWVDSQSDFKGKGLLGGLAGKFMRSGDSSEITDLPALSIYKLNPKKKEYTVTPIRKISEETKGEKAESGEEARGQEKTQSDIKITKSEFKVEDTGESSTINNFPVRKYTVNWLTEWENVRTGEKGTNTLATLVWATPLSDTFVKAREEEMKFSQEYFKAIGLNAGQVQQEILGTNWFSMLDTMNKAKGRPGQDFSQFGSEMKKIKGYPVIIDGKYFAVSQNAKGEAGQEEEKSSKGILGGLAKKVLKKKPAGDEGKEPALSYYIELVELSLAGLSANDFQVPADYKKK